MDQHYVDQYQKGDGKWYVMRDGVELLVAKNGALMRMNDNGKPQFVKGATVATAITSSEMGKEYARRRAEKRKEIVLEAANEAVERQDYKTRFGNYAYIAAMVETAMMKATTPDDPKMVEAAKFVMKQAGDLEDDAPEAQKNESVLAALGREALEHLLEKQREKRANE